MLETFRCTYALDGSPASRLSVPRFPPPPTLPSELKELFQQQEEERYRLRLQHVMEKDKIILACEQEILRVNAQAARAAAGQTVGSQISPKFRTQSLDWRFGPRGVTFTFL